MPLISRRAVLAGAGAAVASVSLSDISLAQGAGKVLSIVGVARASANALHKGVAWYLEILALVSMSLAFFNLLPLLPLDGGHILFALIERVRGRAVAREVYERASAIGFALLMLVMIIAFSTGNNPQ